MTGDGEGNIFAVDLELEISSGVEVLEERIVVLVEADLEPLIDHGVGGVEANTEGSVEVHVGNVQVNGGFELTSSTV